MKLLRILRSCGAPLRDASATALLLVLLAGCHQTVESVPADDTAPGTPAALLPAIAAPQQVISGAHCRLKTELFGALTGTLDWVADDLECSGMPRPNGAGARLRFAGQVVGADRRVAIIIAMPDLARDEFGTELESNVTLIDEGSGRFFSTWDLDSCWTDITSLDRRVESEDQFEIGGTLYCVDPLAEVNGEGSVLISELMFVGSLDWNGR